MKKEGEGGRGELENNDFHSAASWLVDFPYFSLAKKSSLPLSHSPPPLFSAAHYFSSSSSFFSHPGAQNLNERLLPQEEGSGKEGKGEREKGRRKRSTISFHDFNHLISQKVIYNPIFFRLPPSLFPFYTIYTLRVIETPTLLFWAEWFLLLLLLVEYFFCIAAMTHSGWWRAVGLNWRERKRRSVGRGGGGCC